MKHLLHLTLSMLMITFFTVFTACDTVGTPEDNAISVDDTLSDLPSILSDGSGNDDNENNENADGIDDPLDGNEYPVVLLHGFIGWGRDEMGGRLGHYYWGGFDDLQEMINDAGHKCVTAVVGPFSSNWDRACELYAQLKGTRTDYGLAHSQKFCHERFGRDYTGKALFPGWGESGDYEKIHIIAHSQGAMTARMFAQLMENGFSEEMEADYPDDAPISPFFTGYDDTKDKICSITTMAGVNNGTTLANGVDKLVPIVQEIVVSVVDLLSIDPNGSFFNIYDFKLQHYGLCCRQKGETLKAYFDRVRTTWENYFSGTKKDICIWDLSPEGCREQNAWVHAQPNIYYISYAGESSYSSPVASARDNYERHQLPDINSFIAWHITGNMMGGYTCNDDRYKGLWRARNGEFYGMDVEDRVQIDSAWWENDGIVNTITMKGAFLYPEDYTGEKDVIVDWDETPETLEKGVWNYAGVLENVDHFDVVGTEFLYMGRDNHNCPRFEHVEDWYVEMTDMLSTLN